jgi:hypothetical protein
VAGVEDGEEDGGTLNAETNVVVERPVSQPSNRPGRRLITTKARKKSARCWTGASPAQRYYCCLLPCPGRNLLASSPTFSFQTL